MLSCETWRTTITICYWRLRGSGHVLLWDISYNHHYLLLEITRIWSCCPVRHDVQPSIFATGDYADLVILSCETWNTKCKCIGQETPVKTVKWISNVHRTDTFYIHIMLHTSIIIGSCKGWTSTLVYTNVTYIDCRYFRRILSYNYTLRTNNYQGSRVLSGNTLLKWKQMDFL